MKVTPLCMDRNFETNRERCWTTCLWDELCSGEVFSKHPPGAFAQDILFLFLTVHCQCRTWTLKCAAVFLFIMLCVSLCILVYPCVFMCSCAESARHKETFLTKSLTEWTQAGRATASFGKPLEKIMMIDRWWARIGAASVPALACFHLLSMGSFLFIDSFWYCYSFPRVESQEPSVWQQPVYTQRLDPFGKLSVGVLCVNPWGFVLLASSP